MNFTIRVAVAQIQAATLKITKTAGGMRFSPFAAWNAIGANMEFTPQCAGGIKVLIADNFTFNMEVLKMKPAGPDKDMPTLY